MKTESEKVRKWVSEKDARRIERGYRHLRVLIAINRMNKERCQTDARHHMPAWWHRGYLRLLDLEEKWREL